MNRPGIRHALLKPEFAHLYPRHSTTKRQPAAVMMDLVIALQAAGARPGPAYARPGAGRRALRVPRRGIRGGIRRRAKGEAGQRRRRNLEE